MKVLISILLLFCFIVSNAQEAGSEKAKSFAEKFLLSKYQGKKSFVQPLSLQEIYQSSDTVPTKLYAFQGKQPGFVLVADNKGDFIVTGYSVDGKFDTTLSNPGLKILLDHYEHTISFDLASDITQNKKASLAAVAPLLDKEMIKWGQGYFFNMECPYDAPTQSRTLVGCVAVTMGQIMRYFKYPVSGTGSNTYTSRYGVLSADFANTVYQWDKMPGQPSDTSAAISKLLYHCGVGANMDYGSVTYNGILMSGAYTFNALTAFTSYFRYKNAEFLDWSDYQSDIDVFFQMIRNEILENRPVYYELGPGSNYGQPGHTVVCDGFDGDYFHLNFGWQGMDDGNFLLEGFKPAGGYDFFMKGRAIVGLSPDLIRANEQDSLALVALYNSTNGSQWAKKSGWLQAPLNQWYGVTVVGGRVIKLELPQNGLSGPIPKEIGKLTSLITLSLGSNGITGSIPQEIRNLTNLRFVAINIANLTGSIPPAIGNLSRLQIIDLSNNELSGDLPDSIYNLTGLTDLSLGANKLTGSISSKIGQLTKLKIFSVWNNKLLGSLPDQIGNLSELTTFEVNGNQLSGTIPSTISNWINLVNFGIGTNSFTGTLPDAICTFTKLTSLNISKNKITGLPENIGQLTNLQSIEANDNLITSVPASVSNLSKLYRLNLSDNKLTTFPELGELPKLWDLNLSGNMIESLPESFGSFIKLSDLDLSRNLLSELPASFENLTNLRVLSLRDNKLTSVPVSFCFLVNLVELYLNNNEISGPLPPLNHLKLLSLDLRNNHFLFKDIATSLMPDDTIFTDAYEFSYWDQAKVSITDSLFTYIEGDSAGIDIRRISVLSHFANVYEWYRGNDLVKTGPVLSYRLFKKENEGTYICRVRNTKYKKLLVLETMPLILKAKSNDPMADAILVSSRSLEKPVFSDNIMALIPPSGLRGEITWQVAADTGQWVNVTSNMTQEIFKQSKISVNESKVLLEPKSSLRFRYQVRETNCDPIISDTIRIKPYGSMIIDTLLNVRNKTLTIKTDSIEVVIPANITDKDFKLTIQKLSTPPKSPDTVRLGSVYDVKTSFGDVFDMPMLITLKNVDKKTFKPENIDKYKAVYFDDETQKWKIFENATLSLQDSTIVFETKHLTKLSWWYSEAAVWGYTNVFVRNNIRVFYKDADLDMINYIYGKKQTRQSWHVPSGDPEYETPLMIQDIACFLNEVKNKFSDLGLSVPGSVISVYVKEMDDSGNVGIMGMINNYININRDTDTPENLRSLLAHEYMHYTQDYYISAHAGNTFWMEANAHLADRMVWNETVIPVSESDNYVLNGRNATSSIFEFMSNSWDYWDKGILTQNQLGNVFYCYMAGTFIHYMRSYKEGDKLKPEVLLKETPYTQTWLNYLDSYISQYLQSNINDQYENFVKYIVEGANANFTLLNKTEGEDPLKYFKAATSKFMTNKYIKFKYGNTRPFLKDTIKLDVPYLSSKMVQLFNLNTDKAVVKIRRNSLENDKNKVYLCRYSSDIKKMTFEDLSDKDSTSFLIESHSGANIEQKKSIAYLLFINKDKSQNFTENYDLEYYAIPDISYFDDIGFYYMYGSSSVSSTQAKIHTFTDGTTEKLDELIIMSMVYRYYTNVYHSPLSYNVQISDSVIETQAVSDYIEQTVIYNFIKGNMTIHLKEKTSISPTSAINEREFTADLANVWLTPYGYYGDPNGSRYYMTTSNTEHTKNVIKSISWTWKFADYNWEKLEHNPITTTTYLKTNYEGNNIVLHIQFY